jgi:NAD(P)-dependent dehydrogenase (short-subunit alcohol dehydrogenase family)
MRLADKVVLITGASSGIGRATAVRAAADGAHLVLVARGERSLRETAAECDVAGAASTMVLPADVGDDAAVASMVRRALDRHRRIDVVVSSAGVVSYGRTEEVPAEVFDGVLRTNLLGSVNLARHALPVLREQGEGTLLFVGSVIGHIAVPSMTAYTVSKWALRSLVQQLRLENRDRPDLHIAYVAPGGVDTPIYEQAANYDGFQGRPPPPVASPERVARQILSKLGRTNRRAQLSVANDVIRLGFVALPAVYDLLVGPLARLVTVDLAHAVPTTEGNVLASREDGNALDGGHSSMLPGIARNAALLLRGVARQVESAGPR